MKFESIPYHALLVEVTGALDAVQRNLTELAKDIEAQAECSWRMDEYEDPYPDGDMLEWIFAAELEVLEAGLNAIDEAWRAWDAVFAACAPDDLGRDCWARRAPAHGPSRERRRLARMAEEDALTSEEGRDARW